MVSEKKLLGVIGGLGPGATAHFMNLVTHMTDAAVDQEHLEMIVFSCPSIPDRTRHILDNSQPNPLPRSRQHDLRRRPQNHDPSGR